MLELPNTIYMDFPFDDLPPYFRYVEPKSNRHPAFFQYICIKQLNLYDHSGITISTSSAYPYNDRWDSSPVGFVYITKGDLIADGIVSDDNENWKEAAEPIIEREVQIYDYFLRGEVYSFTLE